MHVCALHIWNLKKEVVSKMYDIFRKKWMKQGIALALVCALAFTPVFGLDRSFAEEEQQGQSQAGTQAAPAPTVSTWTFKGGKTSYPYTGSAIKPQLTKLVMSDKTTVTKFSSITYSGNTYPGKASVTVKYTDASSKVQTVTVKNAFTITSGKVSSPKAASTAYNKIKLTWGKVSGAEGYEIYRKSGNANSYSKRKTVTSRSFTDTVSLGTTYNYKIKAYRLLGGKKIYLAENSVKKTAMVPTPAISSAKRASYNSIKVSWGTVANATGYVVYRSTSKNGSYKKIATVKGSSKTSYTDKKRTTGKYYYYKVKAYKKSGDKNYYSSASEYKAGRSTPSKTKFNTKTVYGYTSATLTWNKSSGAKGYKIYRSTKKSSGYKLVKTISGKSKTKWKNTGLNAKKTYYYKVRPYTKVGNKVVYGSYSSVYKKKTVPKKLNTLTKKYKDVEYVYGGNSPRGWDCSGFTQWSVKYVTGKKIPRTASAQASKGKKISKSKPSSWKPGDVFLYADPSGSICHAALYIGDGKIMHALNSNYDTLIQTVDKYEKWDTYTHLKYVRRY